MRSELELRINGIGDIERPDAPISSGTRPADAGAFARELGQAIESVDRMQLEADHQANLVAQGGGNMHEMAIALEKADLSMRLATKVRNKVLEAYNEVMKMGI